MNPEDRELLRQAILRQCHAANFYGVPVPRLMHGCKMAGYECDAGELERELRHLLSLGFIAEVEKALSPVNRRYATTAKGDDYLERQGLV